LHRTLGPTHSKSAFYSLLHVRRSGGPRVEVDFTMGSCVCVWAPSPTRSSPAMNASSPSATPKASSVQQLVERVKSSRRILSWGMGKLRRSLCKEEAEKTVCSVECGRFSHVEFYVEIKTRSRRSEDYLGSEGFIHFLTFLRRWSCRILSKVEENPRRKVYRQLRRNG
jgi:hypothetical protein